MWRQRSPPCSPQHRQPHPPAFHHLQSLLRLNKQVATKAASTSGGGNTLHSNCISNVRTFLIDIGSMRKDLRPIPLADRAIPKGKRVQLLVCSPEPKHFTAPHSIATLCLDKKNRSSQGKITVFDSMADCTNMFRSVHRLWFFEGNASGDYSNQRHEKQERLLSILHIKPLIERALRDMMPHGKHAAS